MRAWKAAFGIAAVVTGVAGCYGGPSSSAGGSGSYSGGYAGATEDAGGSSTAATLAFVDTGRTLAATPGQGVGVFVTYTAGGQWLIQWTCDTSITNESCAFQISATVETPSSAIALVNLVAPPGSSVAQSPDSVCTVSAGDAGSSCPPVQELTATATTTTAAASLSFTTPPGATIRVDVQLNGAPSSQYFFFVQNGQVNGGYTGPLSDPMEFAPTSP